MICGNCDTISILSNSHCTDYIVQCDSSFKDRTTAEEMKRQTGTRAVNRYSGYRWIEFRSTVEVFILVLEEYYSAVSCSVL